MGPGVPRLSGETFMRRTFILPLSAIALSASAIQELGFGDARASYTEAIQRTAAMAGDSRAQQLVQSQKLSLMNLTWEDTGRYKGSSVGPNISDLTIQVQMPGTKQAALMPVIRHPNFSDLTGDADPNQFTLLVGNEKGQPLRRVSLSEVLANPTRFMSNPASWKGPKLKSLAAGRDSHVLVSAQACFLPVPQKGLATFNPVLFNYQSQPGHPAVLSILATREGTSMAVIQNKNPGGAWSWGQTLYHNINGKRASLTGQRMTDYVAGGKQGPKAGGVRVGDDALNMVLLIQIPLKVQTPQRAGFGGAGGGAAYEADSAAPTAAMKSKSESNVENAVISFGATEGPFTEVDNLEIERDDRFPVRVTIQYYKATSNGVVSPFDVDQISRQISGVYKNLTNVGSLVTGGETGRPTEYYGSKVQPHDWWQRFWFDYESWSGVNREEAIAKLQKQLGHDYESKPACRLYLCDLLRQKQN